MKLKLWRIFPKDSPEWFALLFFPFKTYLIIAPVCLLIWNMTNAKHYVRGAEAEATGRVVLGYFVCTCVFGFTGLIQFFAGRRNAALKNILFAAIAFIILILLLPMCATA